MSDRLYNKLMRPGTYGPKWQDKRICHQIMRDARYGVLSWPRPQKFRVGLRTVYKPTRYERCLARGVLNIIEPIVFEQLLPNTHGYVIDRGPATAIKYLRSWRDIGWVDHYDIVSCFANIHSQSVNSALARIGVCDERLINLIALRLNDICGLPIGSPLSPTLCNVVLHGLDTSIVDMIDWDVVQQEENPNKHTATTNKITHYCRYVDNIIVAGKGDINRDSNETLINDALFHLGLRVARRDNRFLGCDLVVDGSRVRVLRPEMYQLTALSYYQGLGI